MKAIVIDEYGPVEVLKMREVPQPQLNPDHLLVKMHATSVNPVDYKIRKGDLKIFTGLRKPKIKILGFDVAGEVVETGANVTSFHQGQQVYALMGMTTGGAYAEYVSVPESTTAIKPENLSYEEAAAVPLVALTALRALRNKGNMDSGKKVLINGASGGVGTFAVQIAKALGGIVTAVCSTKNRELLRSLGADHVIDYRKEDFTNHDQRYDIIYDIVANKSFPACKNALLPKGIYITTVPGPATMFQILLTSLWPGKKATYIMVKADAKDLQFIKELIEANTIKPVIDKSFPLAQVASAHTYCEEGHTRGKNVITI